MQQLRRVRRVYWLSFVLALVWCASAQPAQAQERTLGRTLQERVEFTVQSVEYRFSEQLDFTAEFSSTAIILEGYVFYQVGEDERIWVYEGEVTRNRLDIQVLLDDTNQPQVFANIRYWFRIASDHGEFFESPSYTVYYDDNRFTWQQAELPPFRLLWHSGQLADAPAILGAARQGVARLQALLPLADPQPLTLRVYEQAADLQRAAQLAHYPWAAGHMQPGQGVVLFAQGAQLERQIAHELAHQMLYESLGAEGYANLPAWLREGIAIVAEGEADPQAAALVRAAAQGSSLLPLYTLCGTLPTDAAQAHMARAQSAALVRYLIEHYNKTGFGILVEAFARSGNCIQAPQAAFGVDMLRIEQDWLSTLTGETPTTLAQVDWRTVGMAAGVAVLLWGLTRLVARSGRRK
ncbi:MAG: hypothetical protein KIS88_00305 [Anaerolineales bacterium]|nr:hypothetical protein [Anaerolineales bacterium]